MSTTAVATDHSEVTIFSDSEIERFRGSGFVVARNLINDELRERMLKVTLRDLDAERGAVELEADLRYPGAPPSREASGGSTVRRLKLAHARDPVFTELVCLPAVVQRLRQLLGPQVVMPLTHHNCIMTKHPDYSSDTGWHQDIRYWSFQRPELISMWVALGPENLHNGGLQLIPGSHLELFSIDRFDEELFFRNDLPENQLWIDRAEQTELEAGDVLFFHCRSLHAASRNYSHSSKFTPVFTFRAFDNPAVPETRSSSLPELLL